MILIKNIRIRYYRSLKELYLTDLNHLNVFSGKNDSGKSNLLRALDVFFNDKSINFSEDYNKEKLAEVRKSTKAKQLIDIRITFVPPKGYSTLPSTVTITKKWDRNGELISTPTDDLESQVNRGIFKPKSLKVSKRSLSTLLRKIKYKHIPGVRDESFFLNLVQELQIALFAKEDRRRKSENKIKKTIKSFNDYIVKITKKLNDDFYQTSNIHTNLSFPSELSLLFKRLLVDTKAEGNDIPLYLRGDGIRLWYIPAILNHIAQISPNYYIWGFDEPENSCEHSLSSQLANDFLNKYSNYAQILLSTHSFAFISINDKSCSRYRIFKKGELNSKAINYDKQSNQEHSLLNEIGVIGINSELKRVYDDLTNQLFNIEKLKIDLAEKKKPFLIFEGESDTIHFRCAYENIYQKSITSDFHISDTIYGKAGSSVGGGASSLNDFLYNHMGKMVTDNIIIGIFDYDKKGVDEIKSLKKAGIFNDISEHFNGNIVFRHKQKHNVYAIVLVPPSFRTSFIDSIQPKYSYLSTELLYDDEYIPTANRSHPSKYDTTVYSFKGDKNKFAKKIRTNIDDFDFDGFKPTFELLKKLIKNQN